MTPTVAIVAPGAMGAGIGKLLASHGVRVLTSLAGRSDATAARAREAGMIVASDKEIAAADFILSILPPGDALALAHRFAPVLAASNAKPVYVDCNAINPATVERVATAIAPTGCRFVDAGINKGAQAIGAAMMLAAMRAGSADALFDELSFSQQEMLAQFKQQLPKMPAKAYRWIAEMQEIAGFVADDPAARDLYEGAARFYEQMAEDFSGDQKAAAALERFLKRDRS